MRWVGTGYTFEAPKTVATDNSLIIYPGCSWCPESFAGGSAETVLLIVDYYQRRY